MTEGAPKLDLRPDHWVIVRDILAAEIPERAVLAFGSRACWTAKAHSDLDLAILGDGPLPLDRMAALREAFEDSDLPFKVDLVDWHGVEARFREAIRRDSVTVQQGAEAKAPTPPTCGRLGMAGAYELIQLGEVASVRSGFAFKSSDWTESGVPVVKISNVKDGRLEMDGCSFVSQETSGHAPDARLCVGDILIAMTGYIGDVALVRDHNLPVLLNQRVGRFDLRDQKRLHSRFLFYVLRNPEVRQEIEGLGYGSAQPNVSPTLIHGVRIPLPPLPEQRAIAHILGTLDDRIEANRRMAATLEEMARVLFRAWFVTFEPVRAKAEGRWRPGQTLPGLPASLYDLFPDRLVETERGEIPEGWRAGELGDVAQQVGQTVSPETLDPNTPYIGLGSGLI